MEIMQINSFNKLAWAEFQHLLNSCFLLDYLCSFIKLAAIQYQLNIDEMGVLEDSPNTS